MSQTFIIHIHDPKSKPHLRTYDPNNKQDAIDYINNAIKILGIDTPLGEIANSMRNIAHSAPQEVHDAINDWAVQVQECEKKLLEADNTNHL